MNAPNQSSNGKPGNSKLPGQQNPPPSSHNWWSDLGGRSPQQRAMVFWYIILTLGMLWFWQGVSHQMMTRTIPYSQFKQLALQGRVSDLSISDTEITGKLLPESASNLNGKASGGKGTDAVPVSKAASSVSQSATNDTSTTATETNMFQTVRVEDPDLVRDLRKAGVEFAGVHPSGLSQLIWVWVVPIVIMIVLWRFLARKMGSMGQGLMSFGASKAKVVADKDTGVTFNDVAGCDEAKLELQEVVTFLRNPERYKSLGAAIPKGILLIGPPGTGKTLLARAVAGEAKVPFFSISGSDFVEMFVGVGAARVRDLFAKAAVKAPCIVFIDELDAVGRQRGVRMGPVNDEREQTLNQLLVGMDGFEANLGVIVLAATNRPEVLDHALLRPGRFDRQIVVDAPDLEGRLAILKLHVRNKPLESEVDLRKVAQQTPGFSGADLANVINEAALLAARHHAKKIGQKDLEDAVDKVVAGPERKSRRLNEDEKRQVAFHEVGHALVAAHSKHADPVHKITIIPHGHAALGYTLQLPKADHYLLSRSALRDKLRGLLGGRAAEEIVFGEVSTGAENDLQQATALARQMVAVYGMSEVVGLAHCAQRQNGFAASMPDGSFQRDCSEQTAREIDEEVKKLLNQAYAEAKATLQAHRGQLNLIAEELLERETLDAKSFKRLLESEVVSPGAEKHLLLNRLNVPDEKLADGRFRSGVFPAANEDSVRNGERRHNGIV